MRFKYIISSLLSLLMVYSGHGQSYQSIFSTETTGNLKWENLSGVYTELMRKVNDTLIQGSEYAILDSPYGKAYIHENTTTGQYHSFNESDTTRRIFMDLSLNLADSFYISAAWLPQTDQFYLVDSVYHINGRKHIQLNLPLEYAGGEKLTFIEGVGTNAGFGYQTRRTGIMNPYLLCWKKNNGIVYANAFYSGNCSINTAIPEKLKHPVDFIFNPASNKLKIILPERYRGGPIKVTAIQINGQSTMLSSISPQYSGECAVDLSSLPSGTYIIHVHNSIISEVTRILK